MLRSRRCVPLQAGVVASGGADLHPFQCRRAQRLNEDFGPVEPNRSELLSDTLVMHCSHAIN
jgi:hypothetical protein